MFTGYFDDAGGEDHGYTVIAGWVSTTERWATFAEQWSNMLNTFAVPWFDMKTLSHFKAIYEPWGNTPHIKDDFQATACRVIAENVMFGVASIVDHSAFARVNQVYKLKEYVGNEYALAGLSCVLKTRDWARRQEVNRPLRSVFDNGTAGRGMLTEAMLKEHLATPTFGSPHPRNGLHVVQLQAADFLAYEIRKVQENDPEESRAIEEHRISLRKLIWVDSNWGIYNEANLIESCEQHPRIVKRQIA